MIFHEISSLTSFVVVVILEIAVCSSAIDILHMQDEQHEDASYFSEKRSLKLGGSEFKRNSPNIMDGKQAKGENIPAFFATLTSGNIGPNYAHDAIKFNDVSLNVGKGYNPSTGKFTAPADGIYQISLSFLQQGGYTSHVQLIKDGKVYTDLHANHRSYDQLSKTVLTQLKKGQTVWVRLVRSYGYAVYGGGRYTTFAGYLISYQ